MMLVSSYAYSQTINGAEIPEDVQYISVGMVQNLGGKIIAIVDYGQPLKWKTAKATINGIEKYNSNMQVFNLFIKEGWTYVDTTVFTNANGTTTNYLFRRN